MNLLSLESTAGTSEIWFRDCYGRLQELLPRHAVLLTDRNVYELYHQQMPDIPRIVIEPGEENKTLKTVERVAARMLEYKTGRNGFLLAMGGGMVTDLAGFVASIYLRGIPFGFVSTTLLSQVDASIGGKTGVNFRGLKNMLGVFRQASFVLCDPRFLATLSDLEFYSGMGELIKHALLFDEDLWTCLQQQAVRSLKQKPELLTEWTERSVRHKARVIRQDPEEQGRRRILNLGHTFGHAYESLTKQPHGICIFKGLQDSIALSGIMGIMSQGKSDEMITALRRMKMPEFKLPPVNDVLDIVAFDKKSRDDKVLFACLRGVAEPEIVKLSSDTLSEGYREIRQNG